MNFTISSEALMGNYQDIHYFNKDGTEGYDHRVLSYVRWSASERLIIVSNFEANDSRVFELKIPEEIIKKWNLKDGSHTVEDALYGSKEELRIENGIGKIAVSLEPLQSFIFKLQ